MVFEVNDYHQLVDLLRKHPEWREELRRLLLSEELLNMPQLMQRIEQTVAELVEAQKRSEERLTRLEMAQMRTDERITRLEQRVDRLAYEMGGLKAAFGATLEEEAASVVETVLRHKGYRLLGDAVNLRLNGEVDVALRVEDAQGRQYSVMVESKARLSRRDVQAWAQRMHSAGWQKRLSKAGFPAPYLVYVFAIRADIGAREAVAEYGIGLLRGEGEVIAPSSSIG